MLGPPVSPREIWQDSKCGEARVLYSQQVNSDRLNSLESESFPRSPLISSPSAAPCSSAPLYAEWGLWSCAWRPTRRTQSLLSPLIIRLCRQSLTEIDIRVNLFKICWPCRQEVAGSSPNLSHQTRVSILSKHEKKGSNYHCCRSICISQSDKLLTVCDILTVRCGAVGSAAANTFNPAASQFPKLHFSHQREARKNPKCASKGRLWCWREAEIGFEKLCGKNRFWETLCDKNR